MIEHRLYVGHRVYSKDANWNEILSMFCKFLRVTYQVFSIAKFYKKFSKYIPCVFASF